MLPTRNTPHQQIYACTENERLQRISHDNKKERGASVATLISDKIDLGTELLKVTNKDIA